MAYVKYSVVSRSFDAKNLELEGKLRRKLRDWRAQGKSLAWMGVKLSETGMYVPKSTVYLWCKTLGIK
jgi:hypothetical protein